MSNIVPFDISELVLYPDGKTYEETQDNVSKLKVMNKSLMFFVQIINFFNRYYTFSDKGAKLVIVGYDGPFMTKTLSMLAEIKDFSGIPLLNIDIYSKEDYLIVNNINYFNLTDNISSVLEKYRDTNFFLIMNNFYDEESYVQELGVNYYEERMREQMNLIEYIKPISTMLRFYIFSEDIDYTKGTLYFQPFDGFDSSYMSIIIEKDDISTKTPYDCRNIYLQSRYFNNVVREKEWCDPYTNRPIDSINTELSMFKQFDYVIFSSIIIDYAKKLNDTKFENKEVYRAIIKNIFLDVK